MLKENVEKTREIKKNVKNVLQTSFANKCPVWLKIKLESFELKGRKVIVCLYPIQFRKEQSQLTEFDVCPPLVEQIGLVTNFGPFCWVFYNQGSLMQGSVFLQTLNPPMWYIIGLFFERLYISCLNPLLSLYSTIG